MKKSTTHKRRKLPLRFFYTPRTIYFTCVGITPNVNTSSFPSRIRFRVDVREEDGPIRLFTDQDGVLGLMDLKEQLIEHGFSLPSNFGQAINFDLDRIEVKARSIAVRLPETFVTSSDRIYFKYNETFGSFNSAVHSARSLIATSTRVATVLRMQREIINQSDALSRIDSDLLLDYTKIIHDPELIDLTEEDS